MSSACYGQQALVYCVALTPKPASSTENILLLLLLLLLQVLL
jgi:hypothetical protein